MADFADQVRAQERRIRLALGDDDVNPAPAVTKKATGRSTPRGAGR